MNKKNVVILTSGLSGSSVLSNLISRAGYWSGDETYKKKDYDTFENRKLVELNRKILKRINYEESYTKSIDWKAISKVKTLEPNPDDDEYTDFVKNCNTYSPWIWKDPRLWITMPYWERVLDGNVKYIHLDRGLMQRWISVNLRRQVQSIDYLKGYTDGVNGVIDNFLKSNKHDSLLLNYDDLIISPDKSLESLNQFLGSDFTIRDLKAVYSHSLYKNNRGVWDFIKASCIYLKNYKARFQVPVE